MSRDRRVTVRFTQEEYEAIQKKCREVHMNQSQLIVSSVIGKEVIVIDGVKEFNRELRKIGINLNQIATLCHMGKIKCVQLQSVQQSLDRLGANMNTLRKRVRKSVSP